MRRCTARHQSVTRSRFGRQSAVAILGGHRTLTASPGRGWTSSPSDRTRLYFQQPSSSKNGNGKSWSQSALSVAQRAFCSSTQTNEKDPMRQTTLFLSNVLPDDSASASGSRTQSLIRYFSRTSDVIVATGMPEMETFSKDEGLAGSSTSSQSLRQQHASPHHVLRALMGRFKEDSSQTKLLFHRLRTNRSEDYQCLQRRFPRLDTVVFDRFYTEEAHSFAIRKHYPMACLVLDMQDMHCLRRARQSFVESWDFFSSPNEDPLACVQEALEHRPDASDTHLVRELSSIYRCDIALVCSPVEYDILTSHFNVPARKLCVASFFVEKRVQHFPLSTPRFSAPPQLVFCGGYRHAPNLDAARCLIRHIWPRLESQLPQGSTLHLHGAYTPQQMLQKQKQQSGLVVHGFTPNLDDVFGKQETADSKYVSDSPVVVLAPLRFGAGIKGKIVDAWRYGCPVVTTGIGSEGMTLANRTSGEALFGGSISNTTDEFCQAAVELASNPMAYQQAQETSTFLLEKLYDAETIWNGVKSALNIPSKRTDREDWLRRGRATDYTKAMLWHNSARSTEYFSKWIELKEERQRQEQEHERSESDGIE